MGDVVWILNRNWAKETMAEAWSLIPHENVMGGRNRLGTTNLGDISR
jgi:hypothetical protein